MAATFDSKFQHRAAGTASPFAFVSNAGTVTGTVGSNSNRVLIGVVSFHSNAAAQGTVTMTWDGVSMTQIGSIAETAGQNIVYVFGLIAPATGNKTLSCGWTGGVSVDTSLGAVSIYNADQTTGWQNTGSDTGTGLSASSTVTTASGNLVVVGHTNNDASSTTTTLGTNAWIETTLSGNHAASYLAAVAGTAVVSWTLGSSVAWANYKVDVIAAASAPSTTVEWQSPAVQLQNHFITSIVNMRATSPMPVPYLRTTPTYVTNPLDWVQVTPDVSWTGG